MQLLLVDFVHFDSTTRTRHFHDARRMSRCVIRIYTRKLKIQFLVTQHDDSIDFERPYTILDKSVAGTSISRDYSRHVEQKT